MHPIINALHSYNRYLILAALVFVLYRSWSGWMGKKPFEKADNTASLVLLILAHTQLLLGLVQYFVTSAYTTGGLPVSDPWVRYFKMEHISGMILAIVLIQLGRTFAKKATTDEAKHKKLAIYTTIATVLIAGLLQMKGILLGTLAGVGQ
ncbi:MAG: cytochrome B [Saprospiraceae bacterium]